MKFRKIKKQKKAGTMNCRKSKHFIGRKSERRKSLTGKWQGRERLFLRACFSLHDPGPVELGPWPQTLGPGMAWGRQKKQSQSRPVDPIDLRPSSGFRGIVTAHPGPGRNGERGKVLLSGRKLNVDQQWLSEIGSCSELPKLRPNLKCFNFELQSTKSKLNSKLYTLNQQCFDFLLR